MEIAQLPSDEQREFLEELGVQESTKNRFIRHLYGSLDMISFLTAGEDEVRSWSIADNSTAARAAGKIHSDLERFHPLRGGALGRSARGRRLQAGENREQGSAERAGLPRSRRRRAHRSVQRLAALRGYLSRWTGAVLVPNPNPFVPGIGGAHAERAALSNDRRRSRSSHVQPPLVFSTEMKALCGIMTEPTAFIRFFPLFCFSRSFIFRVTSPPYSLAVTSFR